MTGAIRIRGRWVSEDLLERISRRSQGPTVPTRTQLVEEFCRATNWRDAKGRLSLSSARVALRRLEVLGKVQLPPSTPRPQRTAARRLWDDDERLPELPRVSARCRPTGLRLRLVENERDPTHRIWNRLIAREHPLGRRPLVGAQLRYVIECDQGILGAFGFGPPAYHLECRDQWIGWSPLARQQNRSRMLGLARFLLRPGLRVPNLASQCYGLVLRQVARDWQQRYGVAPVLVETYVDRARHHGLSLSAANWRRLGHSKGRGRDDRQRRRNQSVKDVWVYELSPKARECLQAHAVEKLAPRSVFARAVSPDWTQEEMDGVALGDARLNRRAPHILANRWARPGQSFYRSFETFAQAKGAYELVENPRGEISLGSLLAPHHLQTARRMAAETMVLAAQDTTGLSYNGLKATRGLGVLGEDHSRGLFLHSLQAFRLDGLPLGTLWAETWARPQVSDTAQRNAQSLDQKESGRWPRALQAAAQWARQMPQTKVMVCGDREADIYELYDQARIAPPNVFLLVRGQHDRRLADGRSLREALAAAPLGGTLKVEVCRRKDRRAREATLELRWLCVEVKAPAVGAKKSWPSLPVCVLWAREVDAPADVEPIEWVLLSTWPVQSLKMARRLVGWYALRWGIEVWHNTLKLVCGVERRQMKDADALERALAFDMIVASRALLLARLGKEHPALPAELFYSATELKVLDVKKKETGKFPEATQLSVLQANILVAMLVGFWARPADGHPGARMLAEGLTVLRALVWYERRRKPT